MALENLNNVFELVDPAGACVCGGLFRRGARSRGSQRATRHTVSPFFRAVRDAYAEASGAIRVLFSQLLANPRPRQASDPLPRRRFPAAKPCVSGTRARFRIAFQPRQGAQRCTDKRVTGKKMQLNARNTSTRGLLTNDHLQIISIATPASLPPACTVPYSSFHAYSMRSNFPTYLR